MPPQVQNAYNAMSSFKQQSPTDYLNSANQQFGVGQAQSRVNDLSSAVSNLQNAVNAVAPSVAGRTSGTFTTQAQRDALTAREQQPLQTDLTARAQDLGNAQTAFNMASGQATNLANATAASDAAREAQLSNAYNTAYAAWQDQLNRAQALQIANMQYGNKNNGVGIGSELGFGNNNGNGFNLSNAVTKAAPGAGGVGSQQADYNWVKGLINGVQAADPSSLATWKMVMQGAQSGNQREKQLMQAFYSLQNKAIPAGFAKALS